MEEPGYLYFFLFFSFKTYEDKIPQRNDAFKAAYFLFCDFFFSCIPCVVQCSGTCSPLSAF